MKFDAFLGSSYQSQSILADQERTVNRYLEVVESQRGPSPVALYPTPGLTLFATLPQTPIRGLFGQDGRCFVVAGSGLYELSDSAVITLRGGMALDVNPATLCSSGQAGDELFVTSGDKGYILDLLTNVFTKVVDDVTFGAFLDDYFIGLDASASTIKLSNLLDGLTWDGTQIAQRATRGDRWEAMIVANRLIYLLGSQSADVWYDADTSPFPFEPIQEAFLDQGGILAPFSIAAGAKGPIWLGRHAHGQATVVRGSSGGAPERLSNHGLEQQMNGYSTLADAVAFTYEDRGHPFYVLNFPTANATWVYDELLPPAMGWHERGYWNAPLMRYDAYRPQYHCHVFGKHLVGDRSSGAVYQLDPASYLDVDGQPIRRMRRAPAIVNENKWIFYDRFALDAEVGVGTITGAGANPVVMLRWSDDGGHTWSNEHHLALGKIGEFTRRLELRRLGRGRRRVWEVTDATPVPPRFVGCYLDFREGLS